MNPAEELTARALNEKWSGDAEDAAYGAEIAVAALRDAIRSDPSVLVALGMEQVGWGVSDGFGRTFLVKRADSARHPHQPVFAVGSSSDKDADE